MKYSLIERVDSNVVNGFDLTTLKIDEAYVKLVNHGSSPVHIYKVHNECNKCSYQLIPLHEDHFRTTFQFKFLVSTIKSQYMPHGNPENVICTLDPNFGEFGYYEIIANDHSCNVREISEPVNAYLPIFTVFIIYAVVFLLLYGVNLLYRWKKRSKKNCEQNKPPEKIRVKSLDTFRGIAIVLMIFANFGCGSYAFCDHSIWNGLHPADLVFPWFMWIMGACIPLSTESGLKKKTPKLIMMQNVLKRSIKLFCLGIILNFSIGFDKLRIFGVLQRFGVCYFAAATICIFFMRLDDEQPKTFCKKHFRDILRIRAGWISVVALLVAQYLLVYFVAEGDCPLGYLGPGGLHDNGAYFNCTGGATGFIDRAILGKHTYDNPTIKNIYMSSQPFDPEGIVGCLSSIFHTFIGVQAGITLITYKKHSERLVRWLTWALVTGVLSGGLCGFSKDNGIIPINKNLWSLSFVLVTTCFAFILLSFCYFMIDVKRKWSGKPFFYAGMNAILMYIGHEMTNNNFPIRWRLNRGQPHPTHFVALMENVWGATFWVVVSYYLYKINYFFTI